jgi:CheY-like chemotaxis protein
MLLQTRNLPSTLSVPTDWRSVVRVDTPAAFLKALAGFKPNLVFSDYAMPEFDGMQALQLALAHNKRVPFILLTVRRMKPLR